MTIFILHLALLHKVGSSQPLSFASYDKVTFYPYFFVKDFLSFSVFLLVLTFFIFYQPNYLGHPDNYIEANHMVTPLHIVPEWYFLPFYAISRSVPSKLNGVLLMFGSLLALVIFPYLQLGRGHVTTKRYENLLPTAFLATVQSTQLNALHLVLNSYFVVVFILLG